MTENFEEIQIVQNDELPESSFKIKPEPTAMECNGNKKFICIICQEETDHPSSSCPYIICKECGEKGHPRKSCPKNQVCLKCGKTGHTIKDCSLTVTLILKKCIEELSSGKCTNLNAETIHKWMGKVGFDKCCE